VILQPRKLNRLGERRVGVQDGRPREISFALLGLVPVFSPVTWVKKMSSKSKFFIFLPAEKETSRLCLLSSMSSIMEKEGFKDVLGP
jgi:hypothetical protein